MKVAIKSIADTGNIEKERIVIRVNEDTDIGEYILVQTGYRGDSVTVGVKHTLWFPDQGIESGDLVVVYTKTGTDKSTEQEEGYTTHFFYWGLSSSIWESKEKAPVLFHAAKWTHKKTSDFTTGD